MKDAQNYITSQHNALGEWLHTNLCAIYLAVNGSCDRAIGPLSENQAFIPMELHWPEDQPNMFQKLEQLQTALELSTSEHVSDNRKIADGSSAAKRTVQLHDLTAVHEKFDVFSESMHTRVSAIEGKVEARVGSVEEKVDGIRDELKEMKEMLFSLMDKLDKE